MYKCVIPAWNVFIRVVILKNTETKDKVFSFLLFFLLFPLNNCNCPSRQISKLETYLLFIIALSRLMRKISRSIIIICTSLRETMIDATLSPLVADTASLDTVISLSSTYFSSYFYLLWLSPIRWNTINEVTASSLSPITFSITQRN